VAPKGKIFARLARGLVGWMLDSDLIRWRLCGETKTVKWVFWSGSVIMVENTRMCFEAVGGSKSWKSFLIAYYLLHI
jgi:hypothetical protein